MDSAEVEAKLLAYATEFLRGYTSAVDINFPGALDGLRELNMEATYFPLHDREIGKDTALAAMFTTNDFFLFFLDEQDTVFAAWQDVDDEQAFSRDWTLNTPGNMRSLQVKDQLGISASSILWLAPGYDGVNCSGTNFMRDSVESMRRDAQSHGNNFGNQAGHRAEADLPALRDASKRRGVQIGLGERYTQLKNSSTSPQDRGQEFEKLWRDALEFHGWRPRKIRISGEENDFTAIYQGLHILGEVRWYRDRDPMDGGKMREFLGKLDPRPQTIGLFVSHSGFDAGALSVVRRAVNSKTVVLFEQADIEAVLVDQADLGSIFDEKLRDAYDYIFEQGQQV